MEFYVGGISINGCVFIAVLPEMLEVSSFSIHCLCLLWPSACTGACVKGERPTEKIPHLKRNFSSMEGIL